MTLRFDEKDIRQAKRFNRLLRFMPRYRTDRRYNARLVQSLLRGGDLLPHPFLSTDELRIEDRQVEIKERPLRLRLIVPRHLKGFYLSFHGGAWVIGTPRFDDPINLAVARECGLAVVSVDHHLAQDDRLDLAIADARRAAEWVASTATREFGTAPIICGGESSGAHLAACALLHLRDQGEGRLAGAMFFYGAYDMAGSPGLRASSSRSLLIDGQAAYRNLLRLTPGLTDAERRKPDLSPLYADLSGLPPALFIAGELDPVFDDSVRMAARWKEASGGAELVAVPQGVHGFNRMPLSLGRKANAYARHRMKEWIQALPDR
jgi:acetyl esterase/lipase